MSCNSQSLSEHLKGRAKSDTDKVVLKSQATQTEKDIIEDKKDEEDYDYVYSNFISPAMLIKLVEQLEKTEDKKVENIYEEIIPMEKKIVRSNSLFFSISQGRREQMELHKFR